MEYSLDQLNYFRMLHIAVKLLPEGLRKIFKREWDFLYSTTPCGIWQDTAQNGNDFYHKETKGRKPKMLGRYLNTVRNGNMAEWDCSCLFSAILNSNVIGATLGSAVRKAVDDLRQVRNDMAHIIEDELTEAKFKMYVGRMLNAFTCLGLPVTEIEEVKNQTGFPTEEVKELKKQIDDLKTELDQAKADLQSTQADLSSTKEEKRTLTTKLDQTMSDLEATSNTLQSTQADLSSAKEENKNLTQEINSKVESFCSLTFMPPHEIIRRSSDIRKITEKMQELYDGSNGAVSTIYLSGNPGCGKSQLARQIGDEFYTLKSRDTEGLIFVTTLNAETLEKLADSYVTLAKKLGTTEHAVTQMNKSKMVKPEDALKEAMCMIPPKTAKFANWLMIVDNVTDLRLVRSYLPQTASNEWGHGQVIITTQDSGPIPSNAPHTYHESLSNGMQRDDAAKLLKQVSQISDQEHAEKVADVLEYQPLALAAAAYFVRTVSSGSPKYSWTEYLDRLRQGQRKVTEEPLAKESLAYTKPMTAAVKMAVERAMEASEVILQTFAFRSLCASDSIAVEVVVEFVMENSKGHTVKELIKTEILKSSLILSSCHEGGSLKYLRVHNIVHDALKTIAVFDSDSTRKDHCIATAVNIFESHLEECFSAGRYRNIHLLRSLASHCKVVWDIVFPRNDENNFAYLIHPEKVVSWIRFMAQACFELSEPLNAKRFSKLAYDLLQNITSTNTKTDTLRADVLNRRGLVLAVLCDYKSALIYFQEALTIKKKIYGEEHREIALSYRDLGDVCSGIGQQNEAKRFYAKSSMISLKLIQREGGDNDANSYRNLAGNLSDIGMYDVATEYQKKALIILKTIHGEEHDDVAGSYFLLAEDYHNIGDYDQALECQMKALSILKKIHREEHDAVAKSYCSLANTYRKVGKYSQAIEYDKKALGITKKIHGEEHVSQVKCYENLASDFRETAKYEKAIEFTNNALTLNTKLFGEKHSGVAKCYHNLAFDCRKIRRYDQAIEFDKKALRIREKIHGEEHGYVAQSYLNLAFDFREIRQYDQAIECDKKALRIREKIHGEEHGEVAQSYCNLAFDYRAIRQYDQAIECAKKALRIREKIHGEEHGDVAQSYHNLAIDYTTTGQYDSAIECNKNALRITEKIHGEEHGNVAQSYYNLAINYREIRQYDQAIECNKNALRIRENIHGEEHGDVAQSYYNLAFDYREIRQYDQAIECDNKALRIREKIHGEEHGDVAQSYHNLAIDYTTTGQYDPAIECDKNALRIREKIHGEEHGDVAQSYHNLAIDYTKTGQYDPAIECNKNALRIRQKIHGEEHGDVAQSYHNLAFNYREIRRYDQAIECDKKALRIREKIHGEEHGYVAQSYRNLAFDYREIRQYDQAIECNKNALRIREKIHGEEHGDVAQSYHNLAFNYREIRRYDQAIECDKKALRIRENIHREEHDDVSQSYHNLAIDYTKTGQYDPAMNVTRTRYALDKRFTERNMVMWLRAITTWHLITERSDGTTKPLSVTRTRYALEKIFTERNLMMWLTAITTWHLITERIDSTTKP